MLQVAMFAPKTDWRPTPVSQLPSWRGAKRIAIDTETRDPQLTKLGCGARRDGYMVGMSFAIEDGPAHYLPFGHQGGGNLDREQCLAYLRDQARDFKGTLVGASLPYDMDYLAEADVNFTPEWYRDVVVAEPLIDENQFRYNLDSIAARHDMPGKDETHLRAVAAAHGLDPKKDLWRLPGWDVGAYAEQDVRLPLALLRRQERILDDQDLLPIWDLESRVLPVLLKMRRRGVRVDLAKVDEIAAWSLLQEQEALSEVYRHTGVRLLPEDTNKARQWEKAFQADGIELPRTPTGEPSIAEDVLATIPGDMGKFVRRAKQMNKLRNTFCESVRRFQIDGRVHCTFNQLKREREDGKDGGTIARLSCVLPNLQQQPIRNEEYGAWWRSVYLPDEGADWAVLDFSQQEPRWTTHYAEKLGLSRAEIAAQRYRDDPTTDNHTMMAQLIAGPEWENMTKDQRKKLRSNSKAIFLGLCYGMGGAKLCHDLGLPTQMKKIKGRMREVAGEEGAALLRMFNSKVPFVRELANEAQKRASERGFILTVLGRRCRFPLKPDGTYDWIHKALNRLIQGSSADQTKKAMVDADAAGVRLQLQVHDELDLSIWSMKEAELLADIMRSSVPCNVPHNVDIETGPNWGEIKEAA